MNAFLTLREGFPLLMNELKGIVFSSDPKVIKASDVFVVCVPTPVREHDKSPDLTIVQDAKQTLEQVAKPGSLIIIESSVGVGVSCCSHSLGKLSQFLCVYSL